MLRLTRGDAESGLKPAKGLRNRIRKGLTLVELAIVLMVLGVIIGIVYASLDTGMADDAEIALFPAKAAQLELNWRQYENRVGRIPDGTSLEVMTQNDRQNGWDGVEDKMVKDLWGNAFFICMSQEGTREICSYGADAQPGGEGQNADFYLTDKSSWPGYLRRGN